MKEIKGFNGEYRFLSNFYPCRIKYRDLIFSSVEAAFQAAKCAVPADMIPFQEYSPSEAKARGRKVSLRPDWEQYKVSVMRELLQSKFQANPELLGQLLKTGDAVLIETNNWHDNFWGNCTCTRCQSIPGKNVLGNLLMQVRNTFLSGEEIKKTAHENQSVNGSPQYMEITLDFSKLLSKDAILQYLEENGATDSALADIREKYTNEFGNELMWRYPISAGLHAGAFIIPVQEGFLSIPYDEMDAEYYELLTLEGAGLMDEDELALFCKDLKSYTDSFCSAMEDAASILLFRKQSEKNGLSKNRLHDFEPTDSQGHSMEYTKCGRTLSIFEKEDWNKGLEEQCSK